MAAQPPARPATSTQPSAPVYQKFVLTDPIAFRYLEEDPSTHVLARRETLQGYDCYLVEQWACSRTDPTFLITTYTGDPKSKVSVSVLGVPADESTWSPRLKIYFQSLAQYYARRKETPLGTILVTNLSGFPSALTVIPVPNGDIKASREAFFVNENLKRLGCSGRVGLTLGTPTPATTAKFYQLYKASDKIPLNAAVIELVKLCQISLTLFDTLDAEYADGLLCDFTEKAINDWWVEFGTEYYSIEPHDGILGPTTISALLGTLMGARNRLHAYGAPVSKDVFDVQSTKRAIAHFQKGHRLPKTRRLDRQTLARIHRSTAKAVTKDGWFVPRVVKSTVADLSGKGGEMVLDMVGAGNKASIAEVETVDIDQFIEHIQGSRAKYLWQGKPRKSTRDSNRSDHLDRTPLLVQQQTATSPILSSPLEPSPIEMPERRERATLTKKPPDGPSAPRHQESSRGLGRIKDAVGGLRHAPRPSRDGIERPDLNGLHSTTEISANQPGMTSVDGPPTNALPHAPGILTDLPQTQTLTETPVNESNLYLEHVEPPSDSDRPADVDVIPSPYVHTPFRSPSPSIAGSTYRGVDLDELFSKSGQRGRTVGQSFKRTQSFTQTDAQSSKRNPERWPRHLSFSLAEDSVLKWDPVGEGTDTDDIGFDWVKAERTRRLREDLYELETEVVAWVNAEIEKVEQIQQQLVDDQKELESVVEVKTEEYAHLSSGSKEVLALEREELESATKEIEVLGAKLEYEINVLRGNVEDVEEGVAEFERQVGMVEERVAQLQKSMEPKESWLHWSLRVLTGFGKPDRAENSGT